MLIFALIIYVFSDQENGVIGKLLQTSLMRTIGKYSYSIYLLHIFIISLAELTLRYGFRIELSTTRGWQSVGINILICGVTILVSKYTYEYIENHFRKKAKKILIEG